jgi:hypothetical protein
MEEADVAGRNVRRSTKQRQRAQQQTTIKPMLVDRMR